MLGHFPKGAACAHAAPMLTRVGKGRQWRGHHMIHYHYGGWYVIKVTILAT
mgnify:CR=1 FL=1